MSDLCRFGLPIAFLIAAGVTCLFLVFAPAAHAPGIAYMTGRVQVHEVHTVPYQPAATEEATTNA